MTFLDEQPLYKARVAAKSSTSSPSDSDESIPNCHKHLIVSQPLLQNLWRGFRLALYVGVTQLASHDQIDGDQNHNHMTGLRFINDAVQNCV